MESRKKRKEKIEKFFENMSEEELDDMLERNGINDHESEEAACFRLIKKKLKGAYGNDLRCIRCLSSYYKL